MFLFLGVCWYEEALVVLLFEVFVVVLLLDDFYIFYMGGIIGMFKGVLWC